MLIADDERPARAKVRRFVEADPEVALIYEATDGHRALEAIRDEAPDVAFLDVEMPGLTGVDVLEALPVDAWPHVVFVTAYDAYAVRAFDLEAVDYLLKPFDAARFRRAMNRAKRAARDRRTAEEVAALERLLLTVAGGARHIERVLADDGGRKTLVRLADVSRIEAERNYLRLFVGATSYRVRATLADLEARLDPSCFARVGKGAMVNLDHVASLEPVGHGDYLIRLTDGARVRLSRRYRDRMDQFEGRPSR